MPLKIVRNDITAMEVDAIVSSAGEDLSGSGGVEAAIRRAAIEYPDVHFVFIDGYPLTDDAGNTLSNVAGIADPTPEEMEAAILSAKADLEKKQATVTLAAPVSDQELKDAVTEAGYEVVSIQ